MEVEERERERVRSITVSNPPAIMSSNKSTDKKMFFTTSDLLQRLNSSINDSVGQNAPSGGFELQRQMPDGSYRRAEEKELAAANFQTKMKQVCLQLDNFTIFDVSPNNLSFPSGS